MLPIGDTGPAGVEVQQPPIHRRHPAELTTFIAALVAVAAELGLDLTTTFVVALFVVIGGLPSAVTWTVNLYRDAMRDLGG